MGISYFKIWDGFLKIISSEKGIQFITFLYLKDQDHAPDFLSELAKSQLEEYFSGKRKNFDLPLDLNGTEFQKSVYQTLIQIPYAESRSYLDVAVNTASPKAFRAVGSACKSNPILIVVPCHRVIRSDGNLGGFGLGIDKKKILLNHEKTSM